MATGIWRPGNEVPGSQELAAGDLTAAQGCAAKLPAPRTAWAESRTPDRRAPGQAVLPVAGGGGAARDAIPSRAA